MSIKANVDRGLEIRATIKTLQTELDKIEGELMAAALAGEQVPLQDTDREGRQYLARGTGHIVPVVLTADLITGSFAANSEKHRTIGAAANLHLTEFYRPVSKYENRFESGKKFRQKAAEVLGLDAPAFITACIARGADGIAKSAIKVVWDDVKPDGK